MTTLIHLLALVLVTSTLLYVRSRWLTGFAVLAAVLLACSIAFGPSWTSWGIYAVALLLLAPSPLRKSLISGPALKLFRVVLPPMTTTEQEALEAGDVWWDGDLFQGSTDWNK